MPHIPLSTVSGRKMVDITVSTFITWLRRLRDAGQIHFENARHAVLEQDGLVGQPHHVVVNVTKR